MRRGHDRCLHIGRDHCSSAAAICSNVPKTTNAAPMFSTDRWAGSGDCCSLLNRHPLILILSGEKHLILELSANREVSMYGGSQGTDDTGWGFPTFVIVAFVLAVGLTLLQIYMQNPG